MCGLRISATQMEVSRAHMRHHDEVFVVILQRHGNFAVCLAEVGMQKTLHIHGPQTERMSGLTGRETCHLPHRKPYLVLNMDHPDAGNADYRSMGSTCLSRQIDLPFVVIAFSR